MKFLNYTYTSNQSEANQGFKKTGLDDTHFLLAGGGSTPTNLWATNAQLGNYLPITGGNITGGLSIQGNTVATQSFVTSQGYITNAALSGLVPYTGANQNVNLGIYGITANGLTVGYVSGTYKGFNSSTSFAFLNGSSAQQILTKGVLTSDLYSDSSKIPTNGIYSKGNVLTGGGFVKEGGTASQFLKADGSIDSNTYVTNNTVNEYIITDSSFTGVQNEVNKVFTLPTPYKSGSTRVYLNGQRLKKGAGNDYTESSTTQITFEDAPKATDVIIIDYVK